MAARRDILEKMDLDELIVQAMQTENSSVRRLTLNVIERLE